MTSGSWSVQPIAVTGMGAITALGADVESLWSGLLEGRRGIQPIRGFNTEGCRVAIAAEAPDPTVPEGCRPIPALANCRTVRLALHAAAQAGKDAGLGPGELRHAGLILGTTGAGDQPLESGIARIHARPSDLRATGARLARYPKRTTVDALAYCLGAGGPRATLNTACSSGLVALIQAMDWLNSGFCDRVIAGGAEELSRLTLTGFCSLRAVDPEPCRPFDRARRGMTLGEGAGFLVLERATEAARRGASIHALLLGVGHTCDASHLTAPEPEGRGAARAIALALASAGITPAQIRFINAHGTGTPHNDSAEIRAIQRVFGADAGACAVHSVKASIGHCLGAAGAIETIVAARSLATGWVPHTAGLEDPEEPSLRWIMQAPARVAARYGLTTSLGFGGNNACLVLGRWGDEQ